MLMVAASSDGIIELSSWFDFEISEGLILDKSGANNCSLSSKDVYY